MNDFDNDNSFFNSNYQEENEIPENNNVTNEYNSINDNYDPMNKGTYSNNIDDNTTSYEVAFNDEDLKKSKIKKIAIISGICILVLIIIILLIAIFSNKTKLSNIEVKAPKVIYVGESEEIKVSVSGKGELAKTKYNFKVSDDDIAELSRNTLEGESVVNKIIPYQTGQVELTTTAKLEKSEISTKNKIIICSYFSANNFPKKEVTLEEGKTVKLDVGVGSHTECKTGITYKDYDNKIISVDEYGVITALKAGSTKIVVTNGSESAETIIKVTESEKKLILDKQEVTIEVGKEEKITATVKDNLKLTWKSENEKIATVKDGTIKGVKAGKTTITASLENGEKVEVKVTVKEKSTTPTKPTTPTNPTTPTKPTKPTKPTTPTAPTTPTTPTVEAPKVTKVTMSSNNSNTTLAKAGNTITVKMTFDQALTTKPTVVIDGTTAQVSGSSKDYTATVQVTTSMSKGAVSLSISGYKNSAGKTGTTVTNVTTGSKVTIYTLSSWSEYTLTQCQTGELCQVVNGYKVYTRAAGTAQPTFTCPNGQFVQAANKVCVPKTTESANVDYNYCSGKGGTFINATCYCTKGYTSSDNTNTTCSRFCATKGASMQRVVGTCRITNSCASYSYNCNYIEYWNQGINCSVGLSGANCVVKDSKTVALSCPTSAPNLVGGLCYTNFTTYKLATSCTSNDTTKCESAKLYQTRTIITK